MISNNSTLNILIAIWLALSIISCKREPSSPAIPGLNQTLETPGGVAKPVLRKTLPGSWDENWFASPVVYDLDKDGKCEIIASRHSVLYVWKNDGTLMWRAPVGENATSANDHGNYRMYCSLVVGDLNNDGLGEIAIAYNNCVAVYNNKGVILAGWPQQFPSATDEIRSLAASDINNDGRAELIAVKTSSGPVTVVWNIEGTRLNGWPQIIDRSDKSKNDYGGYNQNVGCADLDGDKKKDIVCTYDICHIGVFKGDGTCFNANPMFTGKYSCSVPMFHDIALAKQGWGQDGNDRDEFTYSPPVFADMNQDGLLEIILYSDHEKAGITDNRGNCLWVINPDMTRVSGFEKPITTGMPLYQGYENNIVQVSPSPSILQVSKTDPSVIVPCYDGNMYCYSRTGTIEWKVQFDTPGGSFIGASEAVNADLDNDTHPEIVFTTYSTEKETSYLVILRSDGTLCYRIPISGRGSMAAPTIADIDNDGINEIIISLKDAIGNNLGGVQIWDIASAKTGTTGWFTGRGNYLRTGEHL
jgi:hypothetical protein